MPASMNQRLGIKNEETLCPRCKKAKRYTAYIRTTLQATVRDTYYHRQIPTPIGLFCWSCGFFTEEGRFKEERESRNETYKATQPMRDDFNKEMKKNRLKKKRVKR